MGAHTKVQCLAFYSFAIGFILFLGGAAKAAITIDPNSTGAADVLSDPNGTSTTLSNPLADPLNIGTDLAVGNDTAGELLIDSGSDVIVGANSYLGFNAGSTGLATIDGTGSSWVSSSDLFVGYFGEGMLDVLAGAVLESDEGTLGRYASSTGSVLVDGNDSLWTVQGRLTIGEIGSGTLDITGGGSVTSNSGVVSDWQDTTSMVTVTGVNSAWTTGSLSVGVEGNGTLHIGAGGQVSSSEGNLGTDSAGNGTVQVEGSASSWVNTGNLRLGMTNFTTSSGTLDILDGAQVSNVMASIGDGRMSTGHVLVKDSDSSWTSSGSITVGDAGEGSLDILEGGSVSNTDAIIGNEVGATGIVKISGASSHWNTSNVLDVGLNGDGTIHIDQGGTLSSSFGSIGSNSGSIGKVIVEGTNSTWTNTNEVFVGVNGEGILQITDDSLVVFSDTVSIGTDGYINMATGGMLALQGDADDSLAQYLDLVSGTDAIRFWDVSLTDWAPLTNAAFGDDYTLEYLTAGNLAGYTLLTVSTDPISGDFNFDSAVDGDDFLAWQRNPDPSELSEWQANYGYRITPAATWIPEPSAGILLLVGLVICIQRECRKAFSIPI